MATKFTDESIDNFIADMQVIKEHIKDFLSKWTPWLEGESPVCTDEQKEKIAKVMMAMEAEVKGLMKERGIIRMPGDGL